MGFGIIQNIDAASMALFLAWKRHNVDLVAGTATHDQDLVISGARIRF